VRAIKQATAKLGSNYPRSGTLEAREQALCERIHALEECAKRQLALRREK